MKKNEKKNSAASNALSRLFYPSRGSKNRYKKTIQTLSRKRWRLSRHLKGLTTVQKLIHYGDQLFSGATLCFENGMQNPFHESEYLVCHALAIPFEAAEKYARFMVRTKARKRALTILEQRCRKRIPAAYLTHEAFFAGLPFYVDTRVLIPRSRLENIFDDAEGFSAWIADDKVAHILDVGTGSGCLAIALAMKYPQAYVDAIDLSAAALEVARINRDHFGLKSRIRLIQSNLFQNLKKKRYDLIVVNPPYVPEASYVTLPLEYRHEPAMALRGGDNGLSVIERLLHEAVEHLSPEGILICEVGDEVEPIFQEQWPDLLVDWLYFNFGTFSDVGDIIASGVFLTREDWLREWI